MLSGITSKIANLNESCKTCKVSLADLIKDELENVYSEIIEKAENTIKDMKKGK